jgi:hypothetical protein
VSRLAEARRQLTFARNEMQSARRAVVDRNDEGAVRSLDDADDHMARARRAGRAFPLSLLRPVPLLGGLPEGVSDAAAAGAEAIAAGRMVVQAASSFPTRVTGGVHGSDLSPFGSAAARSQQALAEARTHMGRARVHLKGSKDARLPGIAHAARDLGAEIDRIDGELARGQRGMALLADLAGSDADVRLLVLSQDTLELRPTGGYIGSYGVLRFAHGTVALDEYQDSSLLPAPEPPLEPPKELAPALPRFWGVSNANWWPDFPTSAHTAADLFQRQRGGRVDGVLALTELATARILDAIGPLNVPGYDKPVTSNGFERRVLYEVEQKRPLDVPRKKFLTELANALFGRIFDLPNDKLPGLVGALDASVGAGDVQLWFADPAHQKQLDGAVIAGGLPRSGRDFLMLVDANLTGSKANLGLKKDVTYQVQRRRDGKVAARLEVVVTNSEPEDPSLNPYYNGYLRVYVPAGARLLGHRTGQGDGGPAPDGPYRVFAQLLDVAPDASQRVRFDYLLPAVVAPGGDYRLTWVRQTGTPQDSLTAVVAGRTVEVETVSRAAEVERSLRGNRVADWLRQRWVVRKLGF